MMQAMLEAILENSKLELGAIINESTTPPLVTLAQQLITKTLNRPALIG
jgi:hypothetical protein